jgi:hypothetical protein
VFDDSDDENKNIPVFLDKCLDKYKKASRNAIEENKANRAYKIYTKRRKGTVSKDGKHILYVFQKTWPHGESLHCLNRCAERIPRLRIVFLLFYAELRI